MSADAEQIALWDPGRPALDVWRAAAAPAALAAEVRLRY